MKKSSFIPVLRRVALFALIFVVSFALSAIIFIVKSDSFCSLGIKAACETYLISSKWKEPDFCGLGNGNMNFLGFLSAKNYEQQKNCLEHSCRYENPAACYYFAMDQRRSGMDVKDIFVSSCEKGPVVATCYEAGEEFLKTGDKIKASEYFLKACKSGLLKSCVMATPFSDDENFQKLAAAAQEQMLGYDVPTKLETEDENGNSVKIREISPEQKSKILDNELALIWPTAAVFFARIGIPERSLHYLKKAITIKKYAIYEVLSDSRWNCKDEACSSIVLETLKDIDAEISFYEKELAKITPEADGTP